VKVFVFRPRPSSSLSKAIFEDKNKDENENDHSPALVSQLKPAPPFPGPAGIAIRKNVGKSGAKLED
jgi:hypothetical protein